MRKTILAGLAFGVIGALSADAQGRQSDPRAFEWRGELAAGQRLYVHTTNGPVRVEAASGRNLEIVAAKSWRRGDPADVNIVAARIDDGVVVCAIWHNPDAECTADGVRGRRVQVRGFSNDTDVSFTIRLPAGTHITARTTNGELVITGASGEISAQTTNGTVTAESSVGPVRASTTNGDLRLRMARLPSEGASYRTTNGSITVELPGGIDANIEARTTNGSINSDFEVMVSGSISPRSLRGRIGAGGPALTLSTTNGSIRIRRQ